ncbi:MAG: twin-arginine translocase TatA/TatE family subunit [Blastomonas sp.]
MQPSIWQLLIVAALVLVLFGRGRISEMMGDVGKGIRSFKQGISDDDAKAKDQAARRLEASSANPVPERDSSKTAD